jgi:hypothetical protein
VWRKFLFRCYSQAKVGPVLANAGARGQSFSHKPLKNAYQWRSRTRPPQDHCSGLSQAGVCGTTWNCQCARGRAGVRPVSWGYIRCGGGTPQACSGRLEIVGGWGRSILSGRFLAHRLLIYFLKLFDASKGNPVENNIVHPHHESRGNHPDRAIEDS